MATTLQHKRSDTASSVPSTSSLAFGEIAINTNDGYLFIKKDEGAGEEVVTFRPSVAAFEESVYLDSFTGDGSTVAFNLTRSPKDEHYAFVTINGVQQQVGAYNVANNQLTFTAAPGSGDEIEVRTIELVATDVVLRDLQKYFYTISGTTSSVTGTDDNGLTLTYDIGKADVFQNGVKLIAGSDYSATNGTSITFTTSLESGDIVEVSSYGRAAILDHDAISPAAADLPNTTADQVVDIFDIDLYRTAKYLVSATNSTNYHATEIMLIHDGTDTYITEYGTVFTNMSLVSFDADITNGNVRLLCTPTYANTNVKVQRITVSA